MDRDVLEVNFDGLVGPTHNYSGLSKGNLASEKHARQTSHPKAAALQGLEKMRLMHSLGVPQAFFPPHQRPHIDILRSVGFSGTNEQILAHAFREAPRIAVACFSASSMWAANAATVAPSSDTSDGKTHLTPANLIGKFHRSLEASWTFSLFKKIFADPVRFHVHPPLHAQRAFADEGAANHTRFCKAQGAPGVHFFVYGRSVLNHRSAPHRYPARQTIEASNSIPRLHGISSEAFVVCQQNPDVIDLGVFHNDVIAVGHETLFFCHERSYMDSQNVFAELAEKVEGVTGEPLRIISVAEKDIPVSLAVETYLFNSQIVTVPGVGWTLIAPDDCDENETTRDYIESLPFNKVCYVPVRESMMNGGGPACLRLRIPLSKQERDALPQGILFNEERFETLSRWVEKHYRDELHPDDLRDPSLMYESYSALDELTKILGLGELYPFQQE